MQFPKFLRIASISTSKIFKINATISTKKEVFDDVDNTLIEILAAKFGFSYQLLSPNDKAYGSILSNGTWNGMVGMVERGEVDLIIHKLSVTQRRLEVIDYSYPYLIDPLTFATTNPEYSSSLTSFLKPFSFNVWISLLACVFILPGIFYLLFRRKYSVNNIIQCSFPGQPESTGEYVLKTSCLISGMLMRHFYTAVLLSFMMVPSFIGVRTVKELADSVLQGRHQCVTVPGAFIPEALLSSNDSNSKIIGENLLKNNGSNDFEDVLGNIRSSVKSAFIEARSLLLPLKPKYFVSDDGLFVDLRGMGTQKRFCCKKQLDTFIHYIWASGIYNKLVKDSVFISSLKKGTQYSSTNGNYKRSLSKKDLEGVFVLLLSGYAISIFVIVFEIIYSKQ